jgi:predicted MFS family arabinose efflux permease
MGPAIGLGLGRFAYALLLPSMREDLGWTYGSAGSLATANAVGYLVGAALAPVLTRRGSRLGFLASLVITAAALAALAATSSLVLMLVLRFVAGLSAAVAVVIGAGLVVRVCRGRSSQTTGMALGTFFGGAGLGILLSGVLVPPLVGSGDSDGWREGWAMLGLAGLIGTGLAAAMLTGAPDSPDSQRSRGSEWTRTSLIPMFAAYALFGVGYMSYMTFIIALLQGSPSAEDIQLFWIVLGCAALVSAVASGNILGRLRGGRGMAAAMAVLTLGSALPLLYDAFAGILLSALLCGLSFLAVASTVTAVAGRAVPEDAAVSTVAALTVAFALGQCIGPAATGLVADYAGGLSTGLALATGVLALGSLLALAQREPLRARRAS